MTPTASPSTPTIRRSRVGRAVRARRAPDPGRHADARQGPRPARARRRAQVPARAARARTSWDVDGNEYLDMTMARRPAVARLRRPGGRRGDPRAARRRHHVLADAPARGRGRRAGARARAGRRARALQQDRLRRDDRGGAAGARVHRPRQGALLRLPRLARLVHRASPIATAACPRDVAALTHTFAYNDLDSVARRARRRHRVRDPRADDVRGAAATASSSELSGCATARGALLIFDEMWTGFRLALGGAQERFGVTADLACFSKAIANGMPLVGADRARRRHAAARARRVLLHDVRRRGAVAGGGGGDDARAARPPGAGGAGARWAPACATATTSCADSLGVAVHPLRRLRLPHDGRRSHSGEHAGAAGADPLLVKSFVQQELIRRGVLWGGFHNLSAAHTDDDIEHLLRAYARGAAAAARGAARSGACESRCAATPVEPVFRRTGNFNVKPKPPAPPRTCPVHARDVDVAVDDGVLARGARRRRHRRAGLLGREHCRALAEAGATVIATDLDRGGCHATARALDDAGLRRVHPVAADITDAACARPRARRRAAAPAIASTCWSTTPRSTTSSPTPRRRRDCRGSRTIRSSLSPRARRQRHRHVPGVPGAGRARWRGAGAAASSTSRRPTAWSRPDQRIYRRPDGTPGVLQEPGLPDEQGRGARRSRASWPTYWGERGVRVNACRRAASPGRPGRVLRRELRRAHAARPHGAARRLRGAVVFLASDASSYMTGANLVVDGGWTAW